ncbi:hypothetical protein SAMN05216464_110121 [Mucilaginibacter pineti]|uniref:Uncharacterized protein n=1 Tax=Mucilaginibacter pineti TaxID=1391627 RepID=A0A1G7GFH4_9SPHI|nr:hypothetical protein [Mucilaginibacter pineti]SDE86897.1 hypothetical protein SAMN05216464_110121 [Mucilaginibacter pineti]
MKPFIYNFLHHERHQAVDTNSIIEYSERLNLSVVKGTDYPAINIANLGTQTMNKGEGTGSDVDRNDHISKSYLQSLGTNTFTRADRETTDSDYNSTVNAIAALMGTNTLTLDGGEPSDSDHQRLFEMMSTRTLTESKETTDSDS